MAEVIAVEQNRRNYRNGHGYSRRGNFGGSVFRCVVVEGYMLQQKRLKKWIGSTALRTRWYNFQPLNRPSVPYSTASQTDGQTDGQIN